MKKSEEEDGAIKQLEKIEDKPKSKSSIEDKYSLVEVPTQTQVMIRDSEDKVLDINAAICKIMNDIDIIKRNLV